MAAGGGCGEQNGHLLQVFVRFHVETFLVIYNFEILLVKHQIEIFTYIISRYQDRVERFKISFRTDMSSDLAGL